MVSKDLKVIPLCDIGKDQEPSETEVRAKPERKEEQSQGGWTSKVRVKEPEVIQIDQKIIEAIYQGEREAKGTQTPRDNQ